LGILGKEKRDALIEKLIETGFVDKVESIGDLEKF